VGSGFISEHSGVDPATYLEMYKNLNSSIHKKLNSGKIEYSVSYITKEIQIIQAYNRGIITEQEAQKWLNDKVNEIALHFQIEVPSNGNQEFLKYESDSSSYEERVKYFSFGFKSDLTLVIDQNDTININDYHFERNFGISPKGTIIMSAKVPKNCKSLELIFNDKIYGKHEQSIEFDLKDINSLPKLKTIKKWKNHKG
jgi:hypothetical protein